MKRLIVLFWLLLGVGFSGILWTLPDLYKGKEVFETHAEYQKFKEAIARPEIRLKSLGVASSEPPIVVYFQAEMDQGTEFSYGEAQRSMRWRLETCGMIMATALVFSIVGIFGFANEPRKRKRQ